MGHPKKIEETIANLPESQFSLLVLFLFPEKVQKKKVGFLLNASRMIHCCKVRV
jgi:hypothetical protein